MATNIQTSTQLWNGDTGFTMSGMTPSQYRLIFDKLPHVQFFAQRIVFPTITLNVADQSSSILSLKQIGEKLNYTDMTIEFFIDSNMINYYEIHNWMKKLSVEGLKTENVSTISMLVGNYEFIFYDVFPVMLTNLEFFNNANIDDELTAQASFSLNYFEIRSVLPV